MPHVVERVEHRRSLESLTSPVVFAVFQEESGWN